jgi:hypothetical protein
VAKEFNLEIRNMGNAAFADDCNIEVARLLRKAADELESTTSTGRSTLRDINGNTVGGYSYYTFDDEAWHRARD